MQNYLCQLWLRKKRFWNYLLKNQKGETNVIAIILIIVIVLGLVVIFRDRITALIGSLFDQVDSKSNML